MFATDLFKGRHARLVVAVSVAAGLAAAIGAAPSASIGKEEGAAFDWRVPGMDRGEPGVRPLAGGPAMRLGRAFGAEDEDCTMVVAKSRDAEGRLRVKRSLSCAN